MNDKKLGEKLNNDEIGNVKLHTYIDTEKVKEVINKQPKPTIDLKEYYNSLSENEKKLFKHDLEKKMARENYLDYLRYVNRKFYATRFHIYLAKVCQRVVEKIEKGEEVKICLSVPPRHGKSFTITETLASWFVGRNPNLRCIITGYNADLAERFGDKNREKARLYWKELFGIEISKSQNNKTLFEVQGKQGAIYSVGLSGGITGNGASLFIIDDPYKSRSDAKINKDNIMETFKDSVMTRLEGKGRGIIVIHTRWLEDDLIGELSKDPEWTIINIPCIAEANDPLRRKVGEALCPELGYDVEWATRRRFDVGDQVWSALYQGHPTIDNGEIFKKEDFRFYQIADLPPVFDEVNQSWDCSFNSDNHSDYVAGQVWGRKGVNHYLLKRVKKRLSFQQTCDMIKMITNDYPMTNKIYIEKKANGGAVIETLQQEVAGIIPVIPKESKVGRANGVVGLFAGGNVFLPSVDVDNTITTFTEELLHFPNTEHDDETDAMTQYLNEQRLRTSNRLLYSDDIKLIGGALRGLRK